MPIMAIKKIVYQLVGDQAKELLKDTITNEINKRTRGSRTLTSNDIKVALTAAILTVALNVGICYAYQRFHYAQFTLYHADPYRVVCRGAL